MPEIHVPELGESVADATVGRWMKSEGDEVKSGETLVELETDKINFEVEAEQDGVLESISKGEGETVGVGEVIGTIGEGGAGGETTEETSTEEAPAEEEPEPAEETTVEEAPAEESSESEEEPVEAAPATAEAGSSGAEAPEDGTNGYRASPSVRRLAEEYEVELSEISGSGASGRITKEDVERAIREQSRPAAQQTQTEEPASQSNGQQEASQQEAPQQEAPQQQASEDGQGDPREERVRMSRRRQTIAQRLVEAQQTAAMLTTFNEVDMTAVMELA